MKVSFNGTTKIIEVLPGETDINVEQDLYSDWKEWLETNPNFLHAFRTTGGDPTNAEGTAFSPKYFFLMNGWRVKVDGENVAFKKNLYVDEGGSPFIIVNNGGVSSDNSDAQVIKNDIEQVLAYDGFIHIDINEGEAGTQYPIGTGAKPVNNLEDAETLATLYRLKKFHLHSEITLDRPMINYVVEGYGRAQVHLNNQDTSGTRFIECDIHGQQHNGYTIYEDSRINDLTNFAGAMVRCYFMVENAISIQSYIPNMMTDCRSAIAGTASPTFDYSNGFIDLSVRAYSGGFKILNSTNITNTTTVEFIAGKFNFDNSNTLGSFSVRGVVDTTNINSGGALVITDGVAGLSQDERDAIMATKKVSINRTLIDEVTNTVIIFDDDGTTPLYEFDLKDRNGTPSTTEVFERVPK